jgi:elongation factor G
MKGRNAAAVGALLVGAAGASASAGVVQWDIQRSQRAEEFTRLRRRASTFEEVVSNEQTRGGYFATCRLGTPGQNVTLQLDTGSSDIWVPDINAKVCTKATTGGCSFGACRPAPTQPPLSPHGRQLLSARY